MGPEVISIQNGGGPFGTESMCRGWSESNPATSNIISEGNLKLKHIRVCQARTCVINVCLKLNETCIVFI